MILTSRVKKRLKRLYKRKPEKSHVVCFDEFGPIELRPYHGSAWATHNKVSRLPATYRRTKGVRHFLAFYDLHQDHLWGYMRKRKRSIEFLDVLRWMRRRYPAKERIYLILDNFSPHLHKNVFKWVKDNNTRLVFTPTNASWLNRIECQFTEVKKFVFEGTHYQEHEEVASAIKRFLNYRNARNRKRKKT